MLIVTKFHAPTNTRGSRYSARFVGGSEVRAAVNADHALSLTDNHAAAVKALIRKFNDQPGDSWEIHGMFSCVAWDTTGSYWARTQFAPDTIDI